MTARAVYGGIKSISSVYDSIAVCMNVFLSLARTKNPLCCILRTDTRIFDAKKCVRLNLIKIDGGVTLGF